MWTKDGAETAQDRSCARYDGAGTKEWRRSGQVVGVPLRASTSHFGGPEGSFAGVGRVLAVCWWFAGAGGVGVVGVVGVGFGEGQE